jgi:hypothetical protein
LYILEAASNTVRIFKDYDDFSSCKGVVCIHFDSDEGLTFTVYASKIIAKLPLVITTFVVIDEIVSEEFL